MRLVTGCSWLTAEALLDHTVSHTTLRSRRNEWVVDAFVSEAVAAYDRIIGPDPTDVASDSSQHRQPSRLQPVGGERIAQRGLLVEIETLHMDRGYDYRFVRDDCTAIGIAHIDVPRERRSDQGGRRAHAPISRRWTVERTHSWLSNYGQLRRNTDQPALTPRRPTRLGHRPRHDQTHRLEQSVKPDPP